MTKGWQSQLPGPKVREGEYSLFYGVYLQDLKRLQNSPGIPKKLDNIYMQFRISFVAE